MKDGDLLLLKGDEIVRLLKNSEQKIMEAVKSASITHLEGDSTLPNSSFVRFPDSERNRIIALPAYLGGEFKTAGIKWIASFPNNLEKNIERASATLILNCMETGRPKAVMESSVISATRTAASAALAAHYIKDDKPIDSVGFIGCGLINFETFRYLIAARPQIKELYIFDISEKRAEKFKTKCLSLSKKPEIHIVDKMDDVFKNSDVIAFATTSIKTYVNDISLCKPDALILHTSLRDLSYEVILSADNIVDDIDHCCTAQTSVHIAEQKSGNRDFIRCTLAEILKGDAAPNTGKISIFSPFGMGVLDLAVAEIVLKLALEKNMGMVIESFLPVNWLLRGEN